MPMFRDEWAWVAWLARRSGALPRRIRATWQEDATIWRDHGRFQVFSVDQLVEGVHFRRTWFTPQDMGRKAVLRGVSDIWVKGARPCWLWLALVFPAGVRDDDLEAFYRGVWQVARAQGVRLVGGDTVQGQHWSVTMAVLGETERPILRRGLRSGDAIWLTGPVGWSGLGVALLDWLEKRLVTDRGRPLVPRLGEALEQAEVPADLRPAAHRAVRALVRPRLPVRFLAWLQEFGMAAIDISDGLLLDLWRLARVNRRRIEIAWSPKRLGRSFQRLAAWLGVDPWQAWSQGGEDYQWLVGTRSTISATGRGYPARLGRVTGTDRQGSLRFSYKDVVVEWRGAPGGWDHLRRASRG